MATTRPTVSVFPVGSSVPSTHVTLPCVMTAPIRPDIVSFVHSNMSKNSRQPYAVSTIAGHQTSAESWGTGRAVSRIPRVGGGGTQRSGQGAFGNMCRGGRMFAPTKIWRRWHRRINLNQKRYAMVSAIAASAVPALVMARGHRVNNVPEIPLVLDDKIESIVRTKELLNAFKFVGAEEDCKKANDSRKIRAGKGKSRNRRHVVKRGPLVIFSKDEGVSRALRNLPGVESAFVESLNLLKMAPGGHVGRFCVWSKTAFEKLDSIYGTYTEKGSKKGYMLPRPVMMNANLQRLLQSTEIKSVLRPARPQRNKRMDKRNPLKAADLMWKISPYSAHMRLLARSKMKNAKGTIQTVDVSATTTTVAADSGKDKKEKEGSKAPVSMEVMPTGKEAQGSKKKETKGSEKKGDSAKKPEPKKK